MTSSIQLPVWRVLVLETDPLIQLGMKKVLSDCPTLTLIGVADTGIAGIEIVHREKPELAIISLDLPEIDGIEATQRIKAALPDTKIIIFTSHTCRDEVLAAFASGADAYCTKGRDLAVLTTAIATVAQDSIYLDATIANTVIQNLDLEPSVTPVHEISDREHEVLILLVEGLSNFEIAKRLYISTNTVKAHIRSLMAKLSASNRVQVAVEALRDNLV